MIPWWTLIIALPVGVGSLIWGWSLGHRAGYDEAQWLFARSNAPDDVPDDVWDRAQEPAQVVFDASVDLYETGTSGTDVQVVIARAILAERERAAKVAVEMNTRLLGADLADSINGYVDEAIRKGPTP